jgi:hypothetical protein
MRSVALCAALAVCTAAAAFAQGEVPVTIEEAPQVQIAGFAVASGNYDRLGDVVGYQGSPPTFVGPQNSFSGDKIACTLYQPVGDAYFYGQLTTTLAPGTSSAEGISIDHLYIIDTPHALPNWSFEFGVLPALGGVEQDDEPLDFVPSFSFIFLYARPSAYTGLNVRFTPVGNFQFVASVNNGWNTAQAVNNGKTVTLRAEWLPFDGMTVGLTDYYGPQIDSTDAFQRNTLVADVTYEKGPLILALELDDGGQAGGSPANPTTGSASYKGAEFEAVYRLSDHWGLAGRVEDLSDPNNVVTGAVDPTGAPLPYGPVLSSITIGPMFMVGTGSARMITNIEHTTFHIPQLWVKTGIRVNYSSVPFFPNSAGLLERQDTQAIIQVNFMF